MSSIDTPAGSSTRSERTARWSPGTGTIVIALVLVALAARLWELGERPLHHDESLDAWWSWLFRNGNYTGYDPVYHGPLRFYITAGFYEIFGESEAVARLFSALTGTAVVGLPWFLRRELGRVGTISAAVALAVSPTMLYYSRFGREDAQMVFLTLLAMVLGLAYLRRPRTITAAGLAFVLAASFAIKESTYLFALLLVVYLLVAVAAQFDAQTRRPDTAHAEADTLGLHAPFFAAGLTLATIGLLLAVIVGSAADELFPMLALYIAALVAFTIVTALPRLRSAGIEWSWARAAQVLVAGAVAGQVIRAYGEPAGDWSASALTLGIGAAAAVLAIALAVLPPFNAIEEAPRWATAFGIGAAGIFAHEWLERHVAGLGPIPEGVERFTTSLPFLLLAVAVTVLAAMVWFDDRLPAELPPALTTPQARMIAGPALLGGLALVANEYTESEPNRGAAFLAVALVVGGIALALRARPTITNPDFAWPPLVRALGAIGWLGWLITAAVFAVVWYVCFTVFGSAKQDWASGFTRAIDYWDSQQEVNRGGQPWYYYLYALPAYEWFFVVLAAIGSWRAMRRPTIMSGLFVWFAIGSLIIYSYAGERMPWLIAHPLLPMLILAGYGVLELWRHREHRVMPSIAVVLIVGLLATIGTSWRASFPNGADSREILSQAGQATPHLTAALDRLDNIDRISRQLTGEPAVLAIGTQNAWPYNWYLRDRPNVRWFNNDDGLPDDPDIDVMIADYSMVNTANHPDFSATLFAMRSWWVPTYNDAGPLGWVSWIRDRSLWEQQPNPNYVSVGEVIEAPTDLGIRERLERVQHGADRASGGFVGFAGADGAVLEPGEGFVEPDDGRDGCGSVDQWFMVRNELAAIERQAYPESIATMGPLDCASDLLATS